jgi:polyferredoxin
MRLDFPSPENTEVFVLMAGAGLLAVLFGPVYCANMCPFGAAQELLALLGLGVRPTSVMERRGRYLRYVVLAAFVSAWMLTGSSSLLAADPLQHAFSGKLASGAMLLAAVALLLSLFSFRFWCRTFCPVGALLSLGGRIGLALGIAPRKEYAVCDLGAVRDRDTECLHCNRCLTAATLTPERMGSKLLKFPRSAVDVWSMIAVGAVALLFAGVIAVGSPSEPAATTPSGGTPRDVDMEVIRTLIEEKKLSDHEALYWKRLSDPEPRSPPAPSKTE